MSYPQLQGASAQLIIQPGETLTEQKNGLAKLTRTYCCAASYASTAKTTLVSGYVPSGYPYLALFQLPSEKVENGVATFTCEFYGVLSESRYYQPYDSLEATLAYGVANYIDLAGISLDAINASSGNRLFDAQGIPLDVITTDNFQYAAPTLIRSFVVPATDGFSFDSPSLSDFQSVPISEFNSVITKGASVNSAMRPLAPQRIVTATGRSINPKRAAITEYGVVRVIEATYELTVSPEVVLVGPGTLEDRPVILNQPVVPCNVLVTNLTATYGGGSALGSVNGSGLAGNNSVRVSLSWDEPSAPEGYPIVGYEVSFGRKYADPNDGVLTANDTFFTKNHTSVYPSTGTGYESGVYECRVSAHNVYGGGLAGQNTAIISFVQAGPALPPRNLSFEQHSEAITGPGGTTIVPAGGISVSFAPPYWDGISDRVGEPGYSDAAILDYRLVINGSVEMTVAVPTFGNTVYLDPGVSNVTGVTLRARTAAGYGAVATSGTHT